MKSVAARIVGIIQSEGLEVGTHLPVQMLADRLQVSRQPVNSALGILCEKGILQREPNRGYFLAQQLVQPVSDFGLEEYDIVITACAFMRR